MQAEAINRRLVKSIWAAAIFFAWTVIQGAVQEMIPAVACSYRAGARGHADRGSHSYGPHGLDVYGANGRHLLHGTHNKWQVHRLAKAYRLDILDFLPSPA